MRGFEQLEVWQKARELDVFVFNEILEKQAIRDFGYKNQISSASGSVMDNIAEGHGRGGNKEFIQFLYVSRGSLQEVKSQIYRSQHRKYIDDELFNQFVDKISEVTRLLNGLIKYLKQSEMKGNKFKS